MQNSHIHHHSFLSHCFMSHYITEDKVLVVNSLHYKTWRHERAGDWSYLAYIQTQTNLPPSKNAVKVFQHQQETPSAGREASIRWSWALTQEVLGSGVLLCLPVGAGRVGREWMGPRKGEQQKLLLKHKPPPKPPDWGLFFTCWIVETDRSRSIGSTL